MQYLGEPVDEETAGEVLAVADRFMGEFFARYREAREFYEDYAEGCNIPDVGYYLIYNRLIRVGKRIIDKRVVRMIDRVRIIEQLDATWPLADEPNWILIPRDFQLGFGIYIQNSIYYFETKLVLI